MMTGHFDAALDFAQKWSDDWEIDVKRINLRESLIAITEKALGNNAKAMDSAQKALTRLTQKKQQGLDDARIAAAELEAYAILGDQRKVVELVEKFLTTKPADAVEDFLAKYRIAQNYAYAGMPGESIATLDALLSGISAFSVPWVELDPAFNNIRNEPGFIAMLERHR